MTDAQFPAPSSAAVTVAREAVAALPAGCGLLAALRVVTVAASVVDPLRFDLDAAVVTETARVLIATMVDATPTRVRAGSASERRRSRPDEVDPSSGGAGGADARIADQLWHRLASQPADPYVVRCLDTALVLLLDHDLAASTLAARVAASARANPYAVVSAALGALEGPLHGAASAHAHTMLAEALDQGSAAGVVTDYVRAGRRIPGLGHRLYPREDPRAEALLALLARWPAAEPALQVAREIAEIAGRRTPLYPNVDLALAVLSVSAGMRSDAGECVFAIARTVGWIAHALEEYQERPLRMRPSGMYVGPRPPQPMPG